MSIALLVPPIKTVKGWVVFFRTQREKISTLKPLTVWIFAMAFRRRKRGTGFQKSCPASVCFIVRQNRLHYCGVIVSFCGAARPAPPTSPKEQKISFHPLTIAVLERNFIFYYDTNGHINYILKNYLGLQHPTIDYAAGEKIKATQAFKKMPSFPTPGYVALINDVIVVKTGPNE